GAWWRAAWGCRVRAEGRTVGGRSGAVVPPGAFPPDFPAPPIYEDEARILTARPTQVRRDTGPVEKRVSRRRKAELPVEFTQGGVHGSGTTADLSARGMFVRAPQVPATGPMLRLKVNLPAGRTLTLERP